MSPEIFHAKVSMKGFCQGSRQALSASDLLISQQTEKTGQGQSHFRIAVIREIGCSHETLNPNQGTDLSRMGVTSCSRAYTRLPSMSQIV